MCIIIYAPKGKLIPKDHLVNSFNNNSDGAGFMYQDGERVKIKKGFMTFKDFWAAFKRVPANVDRVVHFRIATSGKVGPANCHPYPLEGTFKSMGLLDYYTDMGVAHNGVISWCSPSDRLKNLYSDTSVFIINHLAPLKTMLMKSDLLDTLIDKATNSKFAIMAHFGTKLIGDFIEENGIFYSNGSFRYDHSYYSTWTAGRTSSVRNYGIPYGTGLDDYYWDDGFDLVKNAHISTSMNYDDLACILEDAAIVISVDTKGRKITDDIIVEIIEELGDQGCQPDDFTTGKDGKLYISVKDTPYTEDILGLTYDVVRYDTFLTGKRANTKLLPMFTKDKTLTEAEKKEVEQALLAKKEAEEEDARGL